MAKVVVYKKNPCPYCDRAINMLNGKGVAFDIIDLTGRDDEIEKIKNQYNWMTVPIIVIDGKLIGGYNDLRALDNDGKLDPLLGLA